MTSQLLPLLELGGNNKVGSPSFERATKTDDQGFSKTFQEAEKEVAPSKTDLAAKKSASRDNKTATSQEAQNQANTNGSDNDSNNSQVDADTATKSSNDTVNSTKIVTNNQDDIDDNEGPGILTEAGVVAPVNTETDLTLDSELGSLLEGLNQRLSSIDINEDGVIDPAALQQLVEELFVDVSQLPASEVSATINQALTNQPLTIASASQFINDLKKYAQVSTATENAGLKLGAALTSQAGSVSSGTASLTSQFGTSLTSQFGTSLTGERLETLTLQAGTDISSTSVADKFSVDKLNFAQLLNTTGAGGESASVKLSTEVPSLQTLANTPLPATTTKPQLSVGTPFQQSQWGEAVSERVMWMSSQGLQEAEIHLNPSELGPMQVKVSLANEQAHVSFVVSNPSVREALDQNAIRLREMFDGEGLNLVDVDVSDQSQQQADGSEDGSQQFFSGAGSEPDVIQGENALSTSSRNTSLLSLYA